MPGQAAPGVEFTHPVLFDYAVALFSLGDPARPASLVDALDERPNLALVLRASIEFRLGMIWGLDESRTEFWQLGARLATRDGGHPLVVVPAAQLAVSELSTVDECATLADLCLADRSGTVEGARQLAYLVTVLAGRAGEPEVVEVLADLAVTLAARARHVRNLAVARLAAEMSRELANQADANLDENLATVAADCAALALAHLEHAMSPQVAEAACQVLAHVVAVCSRHAVEVVHELCRPEVLRSWGAGHLGGLIVRIADVARVDPGLAVTVCCAAWDAATERLQLDVHEDRFGISQAFAALADANLTAATALLLKVLRPGDRPGELRIIESRTFPGPVRTMLVAWTNRVRKEAHSTEQATFGHIVDQLVANLHHDDVWARRAPSLEADEKAILEKAVRDVENTSPRLPPGSDDPADLLRLVERSSSVDEEERARAVTALINAWPEPMEHDLRLWVAARLAHEPAVSPTHLPSPDIYEVLRSVALPDPAGEDFFSASLNTVPSSLIMATPGTPDVRVLNGLAGLACRAEWRAAHPELTSLLTPFVDSPNPTYRYLVSPALPHLLSETADLIDELGQRLATEPNHYVAAALLQVLHRNIGSRATDVDSVLGQLVFQAIWARPLFQPGWDDHSGRELVDAPFTIVTKLAVTYGTTNASELVRAWLGRPNTCHQQIEYMLLSLRHALNPVDDAGRTAQLNAFTLLEHGALACREALRAQDPDETADVDHTLDVARAAAAIGGAVHRACEADHGDPTRFHDLAFPVLRVLSEIPDPAVTRSIVDTSMVLADYRPGETLEVLADAVTGDEAFSRRPHALDGVISLARRYLADHRGLLQDNEASLTALRRLLEVFILTGEEHAISLTGELGDLYR
jgi:hypothetical protein